MVSLPTSSSDTNPFLLLDPEIQRWIWNRNWNTLRPVQERAIPALLPGERDVILSAATSAGKTEAAFFPILTNLLKRESTGMVLSISPLKALINDQVQRLSDLCEPLQLPVLGWHGDVAQNRKQKFLRDLTGVLIITPESLEALFVNRGTLIPALAAQVRFIVIDELHAFIGTERGKQVQSLLKRLELTAGHSIPRVGLSATLGDMSLAAEYLRPQGGHNVLTIDAGSEGSSLKLIVKAFVDRPMPASLTATKNAGADSEQAMTMEEEDQVLEKQDEFSARYAIANYLYRELRGSNNLVFPNSRQDVEYYADRLRRHSELNGVPNEFWAHHGSLSRDLREEAEDALKAGGRCATAICTTTLELGIDIGNVKSVAQVGPPPSVASLRQRMGRSGRRAGESAILRCLCREKNITAQSPISDRIHEGLLQTTAMVRLLLARWVEPPRPGALHASTLVQQILSVIAQQGGATAGTLWSILMASGTFPQVTKEQFLSLLRELGERDLLQQESSGLLLPGTLGEKLINHYDFYAAFTAGEEFRIVAAGRSLGSLPVTRPLTVNQRIIFAGRRWRVLQVDTEHKVISVAPDRGGSPPAFEGGGGMVHDRVRQEMRLLLAEADPVPFVDAQAMQLLSESRHFYREAGLVDKVFVQEGSSTLLFTWRGDWVNEALALLLTAGGVHTTNEGVCLEAQTLNLPKIQSALQVIAESTNLSPEDLKLGPEQTLREKWDWSLPTTFRLQSLVSQALDLDGARSAAGMLLHS